MDFETNYGSQLLHMDFQFGLGKKYSHFGQSYPLTPPHFSRVTLPIGSIVLV